MPNSNNNSLITLNIKIKLSKLVCMKTNMFKVNFLYLLILISFYLSSLDINFLKQETLIVTVFPFLYYMVSTL